MNLVQINERLKDLPMQVIQQYANGMNPEVPPYLALGELQRREMAQKQSAIAQGGQQGPQPSIKEQVEQRAGLMAAQGLRQQQMMQQMAQPRGPMPAPAGIPQPEAQPEMMARGGLAAVPMRREMFDYAGGGIVAFAGGGSIEDKYRQESQEMGEGKRMQYSPDVRSYVQTKEQESRDSYAERERQSMLQQGKEITQKQAAPVARPNATEETMRRVGPMTAPKFEDPRIPKGGLQVAAEQMGAAPPPAPRPPAPRPMAAAPAAPAAAPPATGLPAAAQNVSPFMAEAAAMAREKPVAPTAEGIIAEQNKLLPPGMQEAAMQKRIDDQRARAEQERAAYEKSRPSGLDELINMLGQAGRSKGLSGMAPAYTAIEQQKRAEDMAMNKRQNELLTAIEGRDYEGSKELFGARDKSMTAATKAFQDRLNTNTKTLADLAGVDQRRMDESLNRLNQMELEKLRIATQNRSLNEKLKFEADFLSLKTKARQLAEAGDAAGAAKLEARASDMLSIRAGGGNASVGAARNAISERRLEMAGLEKIMKDEGMVYSDEQKKEAAAEYRRLALTKESGGGASGVIDKSNPLLK
jgi:hypothetical protein